MKTQSLGAQANVMIVLGLFTDLQPSKTFDLVHREFIIELNALAFNGELYNEE